MKHIAESNKGFVSKKTTIILLVSLIVIASGVGSYLFLINKTTQQNLEAVNNSSTGTPIADITESTTFKIPELGIEINLPKLLENLEYSVDTSVKDVTITRFTSQDLWQQDLQCTYGSLGSFVRYSYNPQDISARFTSLKKVGDFYITFNVPQSPCTDKKEAELKQTEQINALQETFQTAKPLVNG